MIFDAHADILTDMYLQHKKTGNYDSFRRRHYDKYVRADVKASVFVNYTSPTLDNDNTFNQIFEVAFKEILLHSDILKICLNAEDVRQTENDQKIAVIVGVEGLKFLQGIEQLRDLYNKGLRHAILTWNETNQYGGGAADNSQGLTEAGIQLVQEMERLGIIIDLAHANEKTYFDILRHTTKPVIVSHGNCKSLCRHNRNYTDQQLLALKRRGGVLGIAAVPNFIAEYSDDQTIENMAKHIDYAVKLMGIDHVGLGLDICHYLGGEFAHVRVKGFEEIDNIGNLLFYLKMMGYSDEDIEKIKYKNFMRIVEQILG